MAEAGDRETLPTDVVIVGAGPSGLAAAIRLKQKHPDIAVTVVEKSAEIGGHILSGAVMDTVRPRRADPRLAHARRPGRSRRSPATTSTSSPASATSRSPASLMPPQMKRHGAIIVSLGDLCRWLAEQATALGVDIFPMTAAVDVLTGPGGEVARHHHRRSRRRPRRQTQIRASPAASRSRQNTR